jgi:inner membrane protease subunit 1
VPTTPRQQIRSFLTLTAVSGIGFFTVGHIFAQYCYEGDFALGISMLPTLSAFGNYVIIDKSYRRGRGLTVGDVISFKHPIREGEFACKRVLGLEGDFVLMNTPGAKNDAMLQVRIRG